jgi:hypothetical protein
MARKKNALRLIHVENAMNNTCFKERISTKHYSNVSSSYGQTKQQQYAQLIRYGAKTTRPINSERIVDTIQAPKNKFR